MPRYKPAHSAHGELYWRCVMWPMLIASWIRRVKPGSSGFSVADAPHSPESNSDKRHATPLSRSSGSWLFSRQGSVWFAGEGDVRPEGWMFARLQAERDSLAEERWWGAFALVSLVAAALLAVATYLEEPTPAPKPEASVAVVEATESVDTRKCVDGHGYRRVHKEMRRKRVHNIFDLEGRQMVAAPDGTSLRERRRYRACKKGAVLVEYTNGRVDSKERVARATQAAGPSVDRVVVGPVRITKIAFDPPGDDMPVTNRKLNSEYVTLRNTSRSARWLTGWILKDKNIDGHRYRFQRFRIHPGRYVRIHTGSGRNDRNDLYWNADNYIWNNYESEKATLKRPGAIVDSCRYPPTASSPRRIPSLKHLGRESAERCPRA
jgi:hypothetical protein